MGNVMKVAIGTTWQSSRQRTSSGTAWSARLAYPAIELVTQSGGTTGNADFTVSKPTGALNGDIVILTAFARRSIVYTAPADWTLIDSVQIESAVKVYSYYRRLNGSETWPYTFTSDLPGGWGQMRSIVTLRNASTSAAPSVNRNTWGWVNRDITTGRIVPMPYGSYLLHFVFLTSPRTFISDGLQTVRSDSIYSSQMHTTGRPLLTTQATSNMIKLDQVCQTIGSLTITVPSRN